MAPSTRRAHRRSILLRDSKELVVGVVCFFAICAGIAIVIGLFIRLVLLVAGA